MKNYLHKLFLIIVLVLPMIGCGGGDDASLQETDPPTPTVPTPGVVTPPVVTPPPVIVTPVQTSTTCVPSTGVDYQVGPGKAYTDLASVP